MEQRLLDFILYICNQGLLLTIVICAPPLGLSLILGMIISLLQAVTQIQEQTLTFVPKMIIIFGTLAAMAPWMGSNLYRFTKMCFEGFSTVVY